MRHKHVMRVPEVELSQKQGCQLIKHRKLEIQDFQAQYKKFQDVCIGL